MSIKKIQNIISVFFCHIKALGNIIKADITEMKSFAKPPMICKLVMESICVLLVSNIYQTILDYSSCSALQFDSECRPCHIGRFFERFFRSKHQFKKSYCE